MLDKTNAKRNHSSRISSHIVKTGMISGSFKLLIIVVENLFYTSIADILYKTANTKNLNKMTPSVVILLKGCLGVNPGGSQSLNKILESNKDSKSNQSNGGGMSSSTKGKNNYSMFRKSMQ